MLRTEKDARQSWCPMVRAPQTNTESGDPAACNTDHMGSRTPGCSGSRCMMWRWGEASPPPAAADTRKGYCGLAGMPLAMAKVVAEAGR